MANSITISNKLLGGAILVALIIQYVLPQAGIRSLNFIAVLIYLVVSLYLLFMA